MTKEDVLQQSRVSGNTVFLPTMQLDRKLYLEVNKALELIGGKWDRKTKGHVFPHDPTELLEEIATGTKRNLKKEYQYFPTPDDLADKVVRLADIQPGNTILEPSAGQGAIVKAIHRAYPGVIVHAYELMPINQTFLKKIPFVMFMGADFLESPKTEKYDRIIANPPFSKNQDIEHFRAMYERLKPGGKLVSVMSPHWEFASDRKSVEFREWLKELPEPVEQRPIPRGSFKESGTDVHGFILSVTKPADAQPAITITDKKHMSTREKFEQLRILYVQNLIAGKYDEKRSIILNAIFTELEKRVAEGEMVAQAEEEGITHKDDLRDEIYRRFPSLPVWAIDTTTDYGSPEDKTGVFIINARVSEADFRIMKPVIETLSISFGLDLRKIGNITVNYLAEEAPKPIQETKAAWEMTREEFEAAKNKTVQGSTYKNPVLGAYFCFNDEDKVVDFVNSRISKNKSYETQLGYYDGMRHFRGNNPEYTTHYILTEEQKNVDVTDDSRKITDEEGLLCRTAKYVIGVWFDSHSSAIDYAIHYKYHIPDNVRRDREDLFRSTDVPTPEPKQETVSHIVQVPLAEIYTDEARFQPREGLNQQRIKAIVENFNPSLFSPIVLWYDEKAGKNFVLAGHHRYYGAKGRQMSSVPATYFEGTEAEAKEFAEIENAMRTEQTALENAKTLRNKRKGGTSEKVIRTWCKDNLQKNCLDAYRVSLLFEDGKGMEYARALHGKDKESYEAIMQMLRWIGQLKDDNNFELTKTQENELFMHIYDNYRNGRKFSFYNDFEKKVKKVVERVFELGVNTGASLNFGAWEDTSSNSAKEFDAITKELEKERSKAETALLDKTNEAVGKLTKGEITQEQFDKVIKKYQEQLTLAQKQLLLHLQTEYKVKHTGKETEMALFGLGGQNGLQEMKDYDADSDTYSSSTALVKRRTAAILPPEEITSETANSVGFWRPSDVQKTEISPLLLLRTKPLLHSLNSPFEMLLWGKYGGGKSTLALFLADDLARNAETLYLLTEEKVHTGRLNQRLQRIKLDPDIIYADNLDFTGLWMLLGENPMIRNIIIDSISKFTIGGRSVSNEDLNKLKSGFPDRNFVFIVHATKQGETFRGFHNLAHDVDTVVKVEDGIALTTKHRDGPQGMPFSIMARQPERAVYGKLKIAS